MIFKNPEIEFQYEKHIGEWADLLIEAAVEGSAELAIEPLEWIEANLSGQAANEFLTGLLTQKQDSSTLAPCILQVLHVHKEVLKRRPSLIGKGVTQ